MQFILLIFLNFTLVYAKGGRGGGGGGRSSRGSKLGGGTSYAFIPKPPHTHYSNLTPNPKQIHEESRCDSRYSGCLRRVRGHVHRRCFMAAETTISHGQGEGDRRGRGPDALCPESGNGGCISIAEAVRGGKEEGLVSVGL